MTTKARSCRITFSNYQITGYKHVLFLGVHWQSLVPLLLTHTHSLIHSFTHLAIHRPFAENLLHCSYKTMHQHSHHHHHHYCSQFTLHPNHFLIEPFSYQTRNYYNNNSNNLGNGRHQDKADRHNAGSCRLLFLLLISLRYTVFLLFFFFLLVSLLLLLLLLLHFPFNHSHFPFVLLSQSLACFLFSIFRSLHECHFHLFLSYSALSFSFSQFPN